MSKKESDIVKVRIKNGECPMCGLEFKEEFQIIKHKIYGKIAVCVRHSINPYILDESLEI